MLHYKGRKIFFHLNITLACTTTFKLCEVCPTFLKFEKNKQSPGYPPRRVLEFSIGFIERVPSIKAVKIINESTEGPTFIRLISVEGEKNRSISNCN